MTLFLLIWVALVAAAAGLALGAVRGRELRRGSCALRGVCEGCTASDSMRQHATSCGS